MKQKVKAMSSEAKASAGIIGSLPFIVAILVTLTTPSYLVPLVTTQLGYIWLGVAFVMMSLRHLRHEPHDPVRLLRRRSLMDTWSNC